LRDAYRLLILRLHPLIGDGLAAAVYTQTTDVDSEVNGLLPYERKGVKFDAKQTAAEQRPSMRQAMQTGPRTEIAYPNGFAVRDAETLENRVGEAEMV